MTARDTIGARIEERADAAEPVRIDTDYDFQRLWWGSMTADQREAYEDSFERRDAEIEVYGRELTDDERAKVLATGRQAEIA